LILLAVRDGVLAVRDGVMSFAPDLATNLAGIAMRLPSSPEASSR
jgi:hypothetical protein